jgi:hypothetical protein
MNDCNVSRAQLMTSWCIILLEKLTDSQLGKKFPAFHGTWRFVITFTSARHLYLSWARSIQSKANHPISWRSIVILSYHLRLEIPSGLFPSGFPTKTLYTPHLSPIPATCPAYLITDLITRTILGDGYSSKTPNYVFSPLRCYLVSLRTKHSPQHPILQHPQHTFLP